MHKLIVEKLEELHEREVMFASHELDLCKISHLIKETDNVWLDKDININWSAKSMDEVKERLAIFAKNGFLLDKYVESTTSPAWLLKGTISKIYLCPRWSLGDAEGATCRLVQTGVKTYPEYKLVCVDKEEIVDIPVEDSCKEYIIPAAQALVDTVKEEKRC